MAKAKKQADEADVTGMPRAAVSIIRARDTGRMVWFLRSDTGKVSFPGGKIEPGESPKQAAMRELYEETGLTVSTLVCLGVATARQWQTALYYGEVARERELIPSDEGVPYWGTSAPSDELMYPGWTEWALWREAHWKG